MLTEFAAKEGLQVILLTDCDLAPHAKYACHVFNSATESPQFFSSYAATLVLLETLIGMVVQRDKKSVQARIEQVEDLNHRAGEYYWDSSL